MGVVADHHGCLRNDAATRQQKIKDVLAPGSCRLTRESRCTSHAAPGTTDNGSELLTGAREPGTLLVEISDSPLGTRTLCV